VAQLPTDLLSHSDVLVGRGQTGCLGGIRGGTQGVRAHMGNRRRLPGGSGGCRRGRSPHVTSGAATDEPPADLLHDIKLPTSEGARPANRLPGAAILWSFRLEHPQHPLSAVRRPRRDDPPVALAQRLRRTHGNILAALTLRQSALLPQRSC
jgi:hypothetical protein